MHRLRDIGYTDITITDNYTDTCIGLLYLGSGVRGHLRSSKVALFDRAHTTLYSSSTVNMPLSITISEIKPHTGRKLLHPCVRRPRYRWSRQIYAQTLGDEKLEWWVHQTVKEFRWNVQPFWYEKHACDRRTDRQTDGTAVVYSLRATATAYCHA